MRWLAGTRLTIRVKQPETEDRQRRKLQCWLDGVGKSPKEQVLKGHLREML